MSKKSSSAKIIRIVSIIILGITICLALAGTIMMFINESEDEYSYYSYNSYSNNYGQKTGSGANNKSSGSSGNSYSYYDYDSTSESDGGIMPLIATLLLIGAFVLLFVSGKHPLAAIGTLVMIFIAQPLLFASILVWRGGWLAFQGYWICVAAGALAVVPFVLTIIYIIFALIERKKNNGTRFSVVNYQRLATNLMDLRTLANDDIISQEMFEKEKATLLTRFGFPQVFGKNGEYVHNQTNIIISGEAFSIVTNDKVIKYGTVQENGNDLILTDEEGKVLQLRWSPNALETKSGVSYLRKE